MDKNVKVFAVEDCPKCRQVEKTAQNGGLFALLLVSEE